MFKFEGFISHKKALSHHSWRAVSTCPCANVLIFNCIHLFKPIYLSVYVSHVVNSPIRVHCLFTVMEICWFQYREKSKMYFTFDCKPVNTTAEMIHWKGYRGSLWLFVCLAFHLSEKATHRPSINKNRTFSSLSLVLNFVDLLSQSLCILHNIEKLAFTPAVYLKLQWLHRCSATEEIN